MHKNNHAFQAPNAQYKATIGLILALSLASCAAPTKPKPVVVQPANGQWQVNSQRCTISALLPEIRFSTDGRVGRDGIMSLRLSFVPSLLRPPVAEVSGLALPLPVEGPGALAPLTGRAYTVQLPYNANTAAQLMQDNAFLTITYQPIRQVAPRTGYVRTREIILGLTELDKACPE